METRCFFSDSQATCWIRRDPCRSIFWNAYGQKSHRSGAYFLGGSAGVLVIGPTTMIMGLSDLSARTGAVLPAKKQDPINAAAKNANVEFFRFDLRFFMIFSSPSLQL
jgi:hypothetical protein